MKNIKYFIFLLLAIPVAAIAQPSGSWPVSYGSSAPSYTPSGSGTRLYFNTATNELYTWQPAPTSAWIKYPKAFDQISGCAAPAYTPTARQSTFAVNSCNPKPELYQYTGSSWDCLNCYTDYVAGTGIDITGSTISNTGDLSSTNEIQTLSLLGSDLSLSLGGGTVTLPGGTFYTTSQFAGNGESGTPLALAQNGASTGQVMKWNGTVWEPGTDATGGGGVVVPGKRIPFGTGSTLSSEAAFTYDTLQNRLNVDTVNAQRVIGAMWDKAGATYNVAAYNIFPDGTDQTAKIQALLDTVYNRGGGHIVFNSGTYRISGVLKTKTNYNGSNIPATPDMWISGSAATQSGNAQKPIGGTRLDMRYQGDTIGCLQFRGTGQVKITDISFIKGAPGLTNTFIHTTLTTLKISDCSFWGYDVSNRSRAIVLGGNTAFSTPPDTSAEMGFQGYGTVIEKNYFNWISTGVMLQTYANAVIIRDNNFWNGCGGFAAIWLACKNDTNTGNVIADNLIEMNHYTWGVYLGVHSVSNSVRGNNFFDGPTGSKNIGSVSSSANTIIEGFNGAGEGYVGSSSINTRIAMDSGDTSFFAGNILLRSGNFLGIRGGLGERIYENTGANNWFQTSFSDISGVKNMIWRWNASATPHEVIQIQDYNPLVRFQLRADATNEFGEYTSSGNMRLYCKSGGEMWVGQNGNLNHLFLGGSLYGGLTSTTTVFKSGQGDKIFWGDTSSPLSGESAGLTSTAASVLRTINGSSADARHQASEFYATGTGANQMPSGTSAQSPSSPTAGMSRYCSDCVATDGSTGVLQVYNGSTWKNCW